VRELAQRFYYLPYNPVYKARQPKIRLTTLNVFLSAVSLRGVDGVEALRQFLRQEASMLFHFGFWVYK
jgi:hypothetical protein